MITSGSGLWLSCQSCCFQYHSFAVRIQYSAKISTAKCWKDVNKEKEVGLWPISKTPSQSIKASLEIAFFLSEFWPSSESVKSFWQKNFVSPLCIWTRGGSNENCLWSLSSSILLRNYLFNLTLSAFIGSTNAHEQCDQKKIAKCL